jgi:hypothetical protein
MSLFSAPFYSMGYGFSGPVERAEKTVTDE